MAHGRSSAGRTSPPTARFTSAPSPARAAAADSITRRDTNGALNTGVTNIKLIRPGYDPNTTQVFTTPYLDHLKQFSVLRFMDWTGTNNSTVVNWSDRTLASSARQSSTNGVAWEY